MRRLSLTQSIILPAKLAEIMIINGEILQNSNAPQIVLRIPDLLEHLTSVFTLEPGDVVSTGTPGGVPHDSSPRIRPTERKCCGITDYLAVARASCKKRAIVSVNTLGCSDRAVASA